MKPKEKKVFVIVPVRIPAGLDLDGEDVAGLVDKILDVGVEDAVESAHDPDLYAGEAHLIAQLTFETPYESANPGT